VEKLEGEKKEEKDAIVSAVREGIAKGEDFNSLYEKYSELKYANGQYFSAQTTYDDMFYYNLIAQVEKAKIGDVVTLESEMGTCIMKKLELDGGAWSRQENKDFFGDFEKSATDAAYQKLVEGYFDDIVVDEAIIKKYSVKEVLPAYI